MAFRAGVCVLLAVGYGMMVAGPAPAQEADGPVAVVTTQVTKPLAAGARMAVEPRDDNDLNLRIGKIITAELERLGYIVDAAAPLRFTFDSDVQNNAPDNSRFRLEARGGQRSELEWQLTWRLPSGQETASQGGTTPLYSVEMVIDEPGELPLWRGKAVTTTRTADTYHASLALAKVLLGRLGHAVDNETVPLR